jgi:hypothetical protein
VDQPEETVGEEASVIEDIPDVKEEKDAKVEESLLDDDLIEE